MYTPIIVHLGRTNVVALNLDADVSGETFTSEIRTESDPEYTEETLIATWAVSFVTNGTDGKLLLTLDDSDLTNVVHRTGYMDVKRMSNGEPLPLFDEPLPVIFKETITQ